MGGLLSPKERGAEEGRSLQPHGLQLAGCHTSPAQHPQHSSRADPAPLSTHLQPHHSSALGAMQVSWFQLEQSQFSPQQPVQGHV